MKAFFSSFQFSKPNRVGVKRGLGIAAPVMVASISESLLVNMDFAMIGSLSIEALAGVGLATTCIHVLFIIARSLSIGLIARIAMFLGQEGNRNVSVIAFHGLVFGLLLGCLITPMSLIFPLYVYPMMDLEKGVLEAAVDYSTMFQYAFIFVSVKAMIEATFSASGKTIHIFVASLIVLPINLLLDYLLIFGNFGFPKMGVEGAALASVLALSCANLYLLVVSLQTWLKRRYLPRDEVLNLRSFLLNVWLQVKLGISTTLEWGLWFAGIMYLVFLVTPLGAGPLALFNVCLKVQQLACFGFQGTTTANISLGGRAFGAGSFGKMYFWYRACLQIALGSLLPSLLLILLFGEKIFGLFLDTSELGGINWYWLGALLVVINLSRLINNLAGSSLRSMGIVSHFFISLCVAQAITFALGFTFIRVFEWGVIGALVVTLVDESMRAFWNFTKLRNCLRAPR